MSVALNAPGQVIGTFNLDGPHAACEFLDPSLPIAVSVSVDGM